MPGTFPPCSGAAHQVAGGTSLVFSGNHAALTGVAMCLCALLGWGVFKVKEHAEAEGT